MLNNIVNSVWKYLYVKHFELIGILYFNHFSLESTDEKIFKLNDIIS